MPRQGALDMNDTLFNEIYAALGFVDIEIEPSGVSERIVPRYLA